MPSAVAHRAFARSKRVLKPLVLAVALGLAACGGGGGGGDAGGSTGTGTDTGAGAGSGGGSSAATLNPLPVGSGVVVFEASSATPPAPRLVQLNASTGQTVASATPCVDVGNDLTSADPRPDGYVIASSYNVLYTIDMLNGRCQKLADAPAEATTGLSVAVAADGRIFAATAQTLADGFKLYVFNASGVLQSSIVLSGAGIELGFIKGIDFDAAGTLWMSVFNADNAVQGYQMVTVDPATGVMSARFPTVDLKGDIDIGSDGLLRSHGTDKAIHVIDLGSGAVTATLPTGLDADKAFVYR